MDPILALFKAAEEGSTEELQKLLRDDRFLLESVGACGANSPLQIAAMLGHLEFLKELINHKTSYPCTSSNNVGTYVQELNQHGFSPVHLASANGHTAVVKELLKIGNNELCELKGKDGLTPLHCASIKGRVEVVAELLEAKPDAVLAVNGAGETCVHVAVRNNQVGALRALVEGLKNNNMLKLMEALNMKDEHGDTVLHLAAATRNRQVIEILVSCKSENNGALVQVNATNKKGLTPLDISLLCSSCDHYLLFSEIEILLVQAGAARGNCSSTNEINPIVDENINITSAADHEEDEQQQQQQHMDYTKIWKEEFLMCRDLSKEKPQEMRNVLLVVLSLMTTATYQAIFSPPGGLDDQGRAVLGSNLASFYTFLFFNSAGFFITLGAICTLVTNFPWSLEIYIASSALSLSYSTAAVQVSPPGLKSYILTCVCVIGISFFLPAIVKRIKLSYRKSKERRHSSSSNALV